MTGIVGVDRGRTVRLNYTNSRNRQATLLNSVHVQTAYSVRLRYSQVIDQKRPARGVGAATKNEITVTKSSQIGHRAKAQINAFQAASITISGVIQAEVASWAAAEGTNFANYAQQVVAANLEHADATLGPWDYEGVFKFFGQHATRLDRARHVRAHRLVGSRGLGIGRLAFRDQIPASGEWSPGGRECEQAFQQH